MIERTRTAESKWPDLVWNEWEDTGETLHMWTQIVGQVRLTLSPLQQHWWNVVFYVSARGLTTSAMPIGAELLEIEFDFVSHKLNFRLSTGETRTTPLRAQSVKDFYAEFLESLAQLNLSIPMHTAPMEQKDPVPFAEDTKHRSYDSEAAHRFWRVLVSSHRVFQKFSSNFIGKVSPVHFFWGSFDLAVSRYSGRPAPAREGADAVTKEAYSEEVISVGFWPGNGGFGQAAFYAYAVPSPRGLTEAKIRPEQASYDPTLGEFILKYEDILASSDPDASLMQFLQSTYEAGANLAGWDRKALERSDRAAESRKSRNS